MIIKSLAPSNGKVGWNSTDEAAGVLKSFIEGRPGWDKLDAIKSGRIHLLSTEIAWGPDGIVAAYRNGPGSCEDLQGVPDGVHRDNISRGRGFRPSGEVRSKSGAFELRFSVMRFFALHSLQTVLCSANPSADSSLLFSATQSPLQRLCMQSRSCKLSHTPANNVKI